uniref:CLIP-associating protein 2 n=1 Tax=Phallusia mammillata TaxID=59560 RepID=A0A6F9D8R2_9ASCI|nr:CLIP-associating protein 2 [Phallusia mammillata]
MDQDTVLLLTREQDMKNRMNGGEKLIEFLSTTDDDLSVWSNIDKIVDALSNYWVSSSNFKVALLGLDILSLLVERLQREFQQHYILIQNALVDRLGDQKDQVRDASVTLLTNIMEVACSPQFIFEKLSPAFSHKVWRVREGVCRLLVATINRFGAKSLYLSRLLPHVCKLLSDPHSQVRDSAVSTIVEIYRHVGEKVRQDLAKKNLPPARLNALYDKFDEFLRSGDMVVASDTASLASSTGSFDSADSPSSAGLMRPPLTTIVANNNNSRNIPARVTLSAVDGPTRSSSSQPRRSVATAQPRMSTVTRSNAGAIDEDSFSRDFENNLPTVRIFSARDLSEQISKIRATLSNEQKDWEERTKALKTLRAVIVAGGVEYDAFYQHLRELEPALQINAKDLRSQVVKETCVTIGFLSTRLQNQFEHCACVLLPTLFTLIANSAKIMSSSSIMSLRTIFQHTHSPKIVPIVITYCTSKTNTIRRQTFAFLGVIFQNWATQLLERHVALLKEAVHKGINDADAETREEGRKAWCGLHQHFPVEAEQVFAGLNPAQQKLIKGNIGVSSSLDSLPKSDNVRKPRTTITTTTGAARRIPPARAPPSAGLRGAGSNARFMRSRSDIDPAAAQRSKMKANIRTSTLGRAGRANGRMSTTNYSSNNSAQDRGRKTERPAVSQRKSLSANPSPVRTLPPQPNYSSLPRRGKKSAPGKSHLALPPVSNKRSQKSVSKEVLAKQTPIDPNWLDNKLKSLLVTNTAPSVCSDYNSLFPDTNPSSVNISPPYEVPPMDEASIYYPDFGFGENLLTNDDTYFSDASTSWAKPGNFSSHSLPRAKRKLAFDDVKLAAVVRARPTQRSLSATRFAGSRSNSPGAQKKLYGLVTPTRNKTRLASHGSNRDSSPNRDNDSVFNGAMAQSTRTPPSSPTPTRRSRIPVSNSRTGSRAGSRVGSRVGSPTGSRGGSRSTSPHRYRGRTTSTVSNHGVPPMRVLPKGREGEQALTDALLRKQSKKTTVDGYAMSDNDDDMSDTSSVCSDRSSSYSRNGLKRSQPHTEDIVEILQLCQSGLWTERKEGLKSLHSLVCKQKDFSRMHLKKILEIFNRMFADPNGKVFSMFLEMLPDFVTNYKDSIHDWLYVLLTQLLKKMGADLLGSVQSKVIKALQVTRESFPTSLQFNILSRYIVDQTQKPSLKIKVALLHYMLELTSMMEMKEITNTSDTRLAVSRIITWTTEPKSHDVRRVAESLVVALFDLNASVFTMMIRVLPKTFQDGAMKVLHQHMKLNGNDNSTHGDGSAGHVIGRAAVSPTRKVVSPRGSVGTIDLMSPRASIDSENMNKDEIAENFRDITASIQKLRLDSSADLSDMMKQNQILSPTRGGNGSSPLFSPPPLQQLQNAPKMTPNRNNKYNPTQYSDVNNFPHFNKDALFDEDDGFADEISLSEPDSNVGEVAKALSSGNNKQRALDDLSRALRCSDAMEGIAASQQVIQWDLHFNSVLSGVLEILRTGDSEIRISSLAVLREMLRYLSNRFKSFAEITIIHVLEAHKDDTNKVVKAAEETASALCSTLPPILCVKVLSPLTTSVGSEGTHACLRMLTGAVNRCSADELNSQLVASMVPGVLKCYDNTESGIRKAAVFCLVALHRVIGDEELKTHLSSLSGPKKRLLQLYIERSQANGPRHTDV